MENSPNIKNSRLKPNEYETNFCDKTPPLDLLRAKAEASRCYFCYDAPCIQACPTEINIPSFIKKISTDNFLGSAKDILSQNIMGGTCARACPVETLCENACVRNTSEDKPVEIGRLQRFATDWLMEKDIQQHFITLYHMYITHDVKDIKLHIPKIFKFIVADSQSYV